MTTKRCPSCACDTTRPRLCPVCRRSQELRDWFAGLWCPTYYGTRSRVARLLPGRHRPEEYRPEVYGTLADARVACAVLNGTRRAAG